MKRKMPSPGDFLGWGILMALASSVVIAVAAAKGAPTELLVLLLSICSLAVSILVGIAVVAWGVLTGMRWWHLEASADSEPQKRRGLNYPGLMNQD